MKFSTRKETEMAPDQLFSALGDFDRIARILRQRGAVVTAGQPPARGEVGRFWQVGFDWRGRHRDLQLTVAEYLPPEKIVFQAQSDAFDVTITETVVALSSQRSRLIFEADVRPRTMRARLLLQTAKLGKAQLDKQFDRGVGKFTDQLTSGRV